MSLRGEGEKQKRFELGELSKSVSIVEEELGESETRRGLGGLGVEGEGEGEDDDQESDEEEEICDTE